MLLQFIKTKYSSIIFLIALAISSSSFILADSDVNLNEPDEIIQAKPVTIEQAETNDDVVIDEDEFANLPVVTSQEKPQTDDKVDTSSTANTDSVSDTQAVDPLDKKKAEQLLKKIMVSFEKISFSLESIALVLNHNQLRIKTKEPMVEEIMKLRSLTHMVINSAITEISTEKIAHLITLSQQLIDHIRYLLTTDLITFIPFDKKMQPPTRSAVEKPAAPLTLDQLDASLQKTNAILIKLETESVNVGLNTFNILFRRLEKLNDDYKIVNKCLWGLGGVAALGAFAFILPTHYHLKIGRFIDKTLALIGIKPTANPDIETTPDDNKTEKSTGMALLRNQGWSSDNSSQSSEPEIQQKQPTIENNEELGYISSLLLAFKSWAGDPLVEKVPMEIMQKDLKQNVGELTQLQNLFTRKLGIISFAIPPISVFTLLSPKLKEVGEGCLEWAQTKRSQLASFLRGGPVKKGLKRFERESKYTFDDVIGNEHAKMVFSRLVEYFVDPESFDRGGMAPVNAILFVGPTRTGKSFFAEAFHGEVKRALELRGSKTNFVYFSLSAAELKQYGVKGVFWWAKQNAPCILFIDEIDKGQFQDDRDSHALSELQVAMSELNTDISKKVIVIAATNKPENMNETIRADGRFGVTIPFTSPTMQDRQEYLTRELAKRAAIIDEYYIEQLAYETEGANYDSLKALLMTAFHKAKIKGITLSWDELEEALNEQFHKMIFDEKTLPEKELLLVAAHEIAHAFTRIILNPSLQLTKVTIRPISPKIEEVSVIGEAISGTKKPKQEILKYGDIFTAHKSNAQKFDTYQDLISELKICLSGHVAEKILLGGTSFSYHEHDTKEAFELAKRIAFHGMQENNMPKAIKEQKLVEAYELVHKYEQEVTELLTKHKEELIVLTNILFEQKTLSCDMIIGILKELKRQNKEKEKNDQDQASTTEVNDDLDSAVELPNEDTNVDAVFAETNDSEEATIEDFEAIPSID